MHEHLNKFVDGASYIGQYAYAICVCIYAIMLSNVTQLALLKWLLLGRRLLFRLFKWHEIQTPRVAALTLEKKASPRERITKEKERRMAPKLKVFHGMHWRNEMVHAHVLIKR